MRKERKKNVSSERSFVLYTGAEGLEVYESAIHQMVELERITRLLPKYLEKNTETRVYTKILGKIEKFIKHIET